MSDNLNDNDLYAGFDEDGNRIVLNDNMKTLEMVPSDCTANSMDTGRGRQSFVLNRLTY